MCEPLIGELADLLWDDICPKCSIYHGFCDEHLRKTRCAILRIADHIEELGQSRMENLARQYKKEKPECSWHTAYDEAVKAMEPVRDIVADLRSSCDTKEEK